MTAKKVSGSEPVTSAQFQSLQDTIDRWRVTVQAKIDKHDKTLYGNGEPGMDESIRRILDYITEEKAEKQKRKEMWGKIQIPVVVSGILTAIAFIFNLVKEFSP